MEVLSARRAGVHAHAATRYLAHAVRNTLKFKGSKTVYNQVLGFALHGALGRSIFKRVSACPSPKVFEGHRKPPKNPRAVLEDSPVAFGGGTLR